MKSRNYCLTSYVTTLNYDSESMRYLIYGYEQCPETARYHLQGYLELFDPMRMNRVKSLLGDEQVHLEPRRGTRDQARDYCMKSGKYEEFGDWKLGGQGKRNDLEECLSECKSITDVVENYPQLYVKYDRGLKSYYDAKIEQPSWREVKCNYYWGQTGTGKSKAAKQEAGSSKYYLASTQPVWFDGYQGETSLIIDDYDGEIPITQLLKMLDGHPYKFAIKGGFIKAMWTKVFITSNKSVDECYPFTPESQKRALLRRLDVVKNFT